MNEVKRMMHTVTITGADSGTDIGKLVSMSKEFPFVEWAILVSRNNFGSPRWPSRDWIREFSDLAMAHGVKVAMHLCGGWVREFLAGDLVVSELPAELVRVARRIQINTHNVLPHLGGHLPQSLYMISLKVRDFVMNHLSGTEKPEFWGYYCDYDWVVFAQMFGTMMDLPRGWPMYCRDIKQLCDSLGNPKLPEQGKGEHNALADAKWNKQAYEFLMSMEVPSAQR